MELSLEQFSSKRKIQKCIWKEILEGSVWPGETEGEEIAKVATGDGGGPLSRQEMWVWCQSYSPVGCGTLYLTLWLLCPWRLATAPALGWAELTSIQRAGVVGLPRPLDLSSSSCPHALQCRYLQGYNPFDHGCASNWYLTICAPLGPK